MRVDWALRAAVCGMPLSMGVHVCRLSGVDRALSSLALRLNSSTRATLGAGG